MRGIALVLAIALLFAAPAHADVGASFRDSSIVSTLAGNGRAGAHDGHGSDATFFGPVALALDKKTGALIVADEPGQRIRQVAADGETTTLAGGGDSIAGGLFTAPAYADGLAARARFADPGGVAVLADGSVIVADTGNACIRRIANGVVTTIAGVPGRPGASDGPAATASFTQPRGLAVARDGTIYVADGHAGIRTISHGVVGSLALGNKYEHDARSLSLLEPVGGPAFLYYASSKGFGRFNLSANVIDAYVEAGNVTGLIALSDLIVAYTLEPYGALVYRILGSPPRVVTGAASASEPAHFTDGPAATARLSSPAGIAFDAKGDIAIADRGNRRIRIVPALNLRTATIDLGAVPPRDPATYHIVYVSNSFAYFDAMWDDSIEGRLESDLNANRERLGIPRPVHIDVIRSNAHGIDAHAQLIQELLGQGSVDLVIWSVNSYLFRQDFDDYLYSLPELTPDRETQFIASIANTNRVLSANGTKLILVDQPFGNEIGPNEMSFGREILARARPQYLQALLDSERGYAFNLDLEAMLARTGVPYYPGYPAFVAYERGAHAPLYFSKDFHFNAAGNAFYETIVRDALEKLRPWST